MKIEDEYEYEEAEAAAAAATHLFICDLLMSNATCTNTATRQLEHGGDTCKLIFFDFVFWGGGGRRDTETEGRGQAARVEPGLSSTQQMNSWFAFIPKAAQRPVRLVERCKIAASSSTSKRERGSRGNPAGRNDSARQRRHAPPQQLRPLRS